VHANIKGCHILDGREQFRGTSPRSRPHSPLPSRYPRLPALHGRVQAPIFDLHPNLPILLRTISLISSMSLQRSEAIPDLLSDPNIVQGPRKRRPTERVLENGDPLARKKAKVPSVSTARNKSPASSVSRIDDVSRDIPLPAGFPKVFGAGDRRGKH
jgi:hypothetical protein